MTRTRIDVRLPPDLLARVDAEAKKKGQTRTMFIERALESKLLNFQAGGSASGEMWVSADVPFKEVWVGEDGVRRDRDGKPLVDHRKLAMDRQKKLNEKKS
jgi:hypothetical protein